LDELLTVDDVAAILRVSRTWVYEQTRRRACRGDQLRHVKIGKYVRFETRAVREFINRRSRGA
jgi:excisionase family DNA binding protein